MARPSVGLARLRISVKPWNFTTASEQRCGVRKWLEIRKGGLGMRQYLVGLPSMSISALIGTIQGTQTFGLLGLSPARLSS
jgi:hypothetical protein